MNTDGHGSSLTGWRNLPWVRTHPCVLATTTIPGSQQILVIVSTQGCVRTQGRFLYIRYPFCARSAPDFSYAAMSCGAQVARPSTYRLYMQKAAAIKAVS
jgi:hypothetical protein